MTGEEKQRIDENFKKLMKDDSGKMILSFLLASMFMSKEELEKLSEFKNESQ